MSDLAATIARIAEKLGVGDDTPGFAVLVGTADDVWYEGAFGCADLATGRAIDFSDNFIIASNTKQMCCCALMLLADRGLLDIDEPVARFFPDFSDEVRALTPAQMMGHTSGLADYFEKGFAEGFDGTLDHLKYATLPQMLAYVRDDMSLEFAPDTSWAYSNSTYLMLGDIVRQLDGRPFGRFLEEELFAPLGMDRTRAADDYDHREPWLVNGYARKEGGTYALQPYDMLQVGFADGNVSSNVRDLLTWQRWLFDGQGPQIISPASKARLFQDRVLVDGRRTGYGLGLFLGIEDACSADANHPARHVPGHPEIWHTGGANGFLSCASRFTEEGVSVIALTNDEGLEGSAVVTEVALALLEPQG